MRKSSRFCDYTFDFLRHGIEKAAASAVGGNLLLELLKDFVGRLTPNDKKVIVFEV